MTYSGLYNTNNSFVGINDDLDENGVTICTIQGEVKSKSIVQARTDEERDAAPTTTVSSTVLDRIVIDVDQISIFIRSKPGFRKTIDGKMVLQTGQIVNNIIRMFVETACICMKNRQITCI